MNLVLPLLLVYGGLTVLVLGIIALVRGQLKWVRIPNRKSATWVSGGALVLMTVGGAIAPAPADRNDVAAEDTAQSATVISTQTRAAASSASRPIPSTTPSTLAAPTVAAAVESSTAAGAAQSALLALPVKGRAPKTGYDRALYGQEWSDDVTVDGGHNGCDTRNDILRRDLLDLTVKPGSNGCTVLSGTVEDPYTATTFTFTRGSGTSSATQIDHVVALSDAWQKGAQQLDELTRRNFANDPRNLQAVDGPTNQKKGDGDAATWLPPNKAYRCTYVARQIDVKAAYGLWVTEAEKAAMGRVLEDCGAPPIASPVPPPSPVPETTPAPAPPPAPAPAPTPAPAPEPPSRAPNPDVGSAYYPNCAAARAAGAAPLYIGQSGYRGGLDRDGDGVACE